jgi:transcriptional regulator of arginine metabolism
MTRTHQRRQTILSIIRQQVIETQEQLATALAALDISASQASISRDIAALGLVKQGGRYVDLPADAPRELEDPRIQRLREQLLDVAAAGDHLLVLKVPPGEANGVALAVEHLDLPGMLGTLAGDDTIFLAIASGKEAVAIRRQLQEHARDH